MRFNSSILGVSLALAIISFSTYGDDKEYLLVIKDHRFEPAELTVPTGERVKLVVDNQDPSVEEFESHELRFEKIIPGNSKATVWVGPLKQGKYNFYGEFHEDTAQGNLISE